MPVFWPVIRHAKRMRRIITSSVTYTTVHYFSQNISLTAQLSEKTLLNVEVFSYATSD